MSRLFASGGQRIGASVSASVLQVNIQGWSPLGVTGLKPLTACLLRCMCISSWFRLEQRVPLGGGMLLSLSPLSSSQGPLRVLGILEAAVCRGRTEAYAGSTCHLAWPISVTHRPHAGEDSPAPSSSVLNEAELTSALRWTLLRFWATEGDSFLGRWCLGPLGMPAGSPLTSGRAAELQGVRARWQNLAACLISLPMSSLGSPCGSYPTWTPCQA